MVEENSEDAYMTFASPIYLETTFYRLIADTQTAAEGAINATKAYENIINYIDQANESSVSALDATMHALNLVSLLTYLFIFSCFWTV